MRHKKILPGQSQNPASASRSAPGANFNQNEIDFAPSPDEVARKAYFGYANQGSRHGHEVQHWLEAEARMLAERKLTRTHGFHNQT
jgi:hypothetical protein